MARILLVDDEPNIVKVITACLQQARYDVVGAASGEEALAFLGRDSVDLMITDLRLGRGMDGLALLHASLERHAKLPVILITAYGTIELAVEAMKEGACDFVRKPFKLDDLLRTVASALQRSGHAAPAASDAAAGEALPHFGCLVGETPEMHRVYDWIERVARSDASVLIQGESGTGKELVARAIHNTSRRAAGPYVALNCAALPAPLLESEMFGHAAGAFTGATGAKDGLFIAAHGGTLFLDEIGSMDYGIQSKLLRVLQEHKVRRVGETEDVSVDVRVIAAANECLEAKKEAGTFREDLFYRISVIPIELPPLRYRVDDIRLLAEAFVKRESQVLRLSVALDPKALAALMAYSWPGNVRELSNAIACAAALCRDGRILPQDLPPRVARQAGFTKPPPTISGEASGTPMPLRDFLREKEREYVDLILQHTGGNRARAAELLGISRATFYRKLDADAVAAEEPVGAAAILDSL